MIRLVILPDFILDLTRTDRYGAHFPLILHAFKINDMKRLVPIFFCLLLSASAMAQLSVAVIPAALDHAMAVDFSQPGAVAVAHAYVVNNSGRNMLLRWEREFNEGDCSTKWGIKICDNNQCYTTSTYSNIVKGALNAPVFLAPGDSTLLDIHVTPNGKAGSCELTILISDLTDPINTVEALTFQLTVNDLASATSAFSRNGLRVFPNPATGFISITSNNFVKKLWVSNILGKRVKTFDTTFNGTYDISDLPDGIYLVSMVDVNGKVLKTVRVSKRNIRP